MSHTDTQTDHTADPKKEGDKYLAIGMGAFFAVFIIVISFFIPCPSSSQYIIYRMVISVAIAGLAAVIPGTFKMEINPKITATGALAVLAFVYHYNPASLIAPDSCGVLELTVYVHRGSDINDRVLRKKGNVVMDLGSNSRSESIGANGEAHFSEIPYKFYNMRVKLGLTESEVYKPINIDSTYLLNNKPIYLAVKAYGLDKVSGTVTNVSGDLIDSAIVTIDSLETLTDKRGHFKLAIPDNLQKREQTVIISKNGYQVWQGNATPETGVELQAIVQKIKQ